VQVISLDGQPLKTAKRILVQAFSEQKMHGFRQEEAGAIVDFGSAPINVRRIEATVRFVGAKPRAATALDEHGYKRGPATLDGATLTLPADGMYTIVER
jgi:hypothetical protein